MSFPRYPKYKDSGVEWLGQVPEHWEVKSLKRIVEIPITDGPHETPQFIDEGVPFVSAEAVASGRIDFSKIRACISSEDNARYSLKYSPKRHDIYMVKSGATTGITAIVEDRTDFNIWSPLAVIRCGEDAAPHFVLNFMRSRNFLEGVTLNWSFGTQQNIGMGVIENMACTLPPIAEQTAIAAFLDKETAKIDGLVAEQRRLMELLKEKRQAVISQAVTKGLNPNAPMKPSGIEWLGDVPQHWEVKKVKYLTCSIEQGWSPQCEGYPAETESEWGVLKVGCVNGGTFNPSENKALPSELEPIHALGIASGDLLISRANTRELVGSAAVACRDYPNLLICDKLYRLRFIPDRCLPVFACRYMGSSAVRRQIELGATGASASMVNIPQSAIMELVIAAPPFAEQCEIVVALDLKLSKFDTLIAEAQQAIDLLQERRTALISCAVTGQIDVRNAADIKTA